MIPVIKGHEVQVLLSAGHSHRKVANMADVSKRTVTRMAQKPKIEGLGEIGGRWRQGHLRVSSHKDDPGILTGLTHPSMQRNSAMPASAAVRQERF